MNTINPVTLHTIWKSCDSLIANYGELVAQNKSVDEASRFSRWLAFSGIVTLLEDYPNDEPLPCRGSELRRKAEALTQQCGRVFVKWGKEAPPVHQQGDITEIKRKLDMIVAKIAA